MSYRGIGAGARPILEAEIRGAQSATKSGKEAARFLGVTYETYKKWAKRYDIFEHHKNAGGKGKKKDKVDPSKGKYPVNDILAGKYPDYPTFRLKNRLIKTGYKNEECECCGYKERRVHDDKMPLVLDYIDGNVKNKSLENLQMLCYNCVFMTRGYLARGSDSFHDPDSAQKEPRYYKPVEKVDVEEIDDEEFDVDGLSEEELKQLMG
jgi:hypothetical protein